MKLQDCINFQLTVTQNAVFSYFKGALAKLDVTPAQYALLRSGQYFGPYHEDGSKRIHHQRV